MYRAYRMYHRNIILWALVYRNILPSTFIICKNDEYRRARDGNNKGYAGANNDDDSNGSGSSNNGIAFDATKMI